MRIDLKIRFEKGKSRWRRNRLKKILKNKKGVSDE